MTSSIAMPLAPMEATPANEIPTGASWQYEPKWDGFRCVAFRRNAKVELQSKSGQPLTQYFPEVVEDLLSTRAKNFVLDGEIVIPSGDRLDFNQLLMRIHPAASRIRKLASETPAAYIVFDLLEDRHGKPLISLPLKKRRTLLEQFTRGEAKATTRVFLSPATRDIKQARRWFASAGKSLDGIIAKRIDLEYRSDDRLGMLKIKPVHTVDCVVGGFRYAEKKHVVGSLLLGLYDEEGKLNHVGFTSSFKSAERSALTTKLEKLIHPPGFTGKAPGGPSRWSTKRSTEWQPLRPKLIVEVQYDHFTGGRFRHGTKFVRWRPDKDPKQCNLAQLQSGGGSLKLLRLTKRSKKAK